MCVQGEFLRGDKEIFPGPRARRIAAAQDHRVNGTEFAPVWGRAILIPFRTHCATRRRLGDKAASPHGFPLAASVSRSMDSPCRITLSICDHARTRQRIRVEQQQVGDLAGLDRAVVLSSPNCRALLMVPAAKIADSGMPDAPSTAFRLIRVVSGLIALSGADGVSLPTNIGWPSS